MKKPNQDLFKLVHSLSVSERRYFKHYAQNSQLLAIFDVIQAQSQYDETAAKASLQNAALVQHFKMHKKRLFDLIVKSLHHYHLEQNRNLKLLEEIAEIHILLKKDLPHLVLERLEACRQACAEQEEYELYLELLNLELRSLSQLPHRPQRDKFLIREMTSLAEQIHNYMVLQNLLLECRALSIWRKPTNETPSSLEQRTAAAKQFLEERILANAAAKPLSSKAKRIYHSLVSELYFALGNYPAAYLHCKARVEVFQQSKVLQTTRVAQYFPALVNLNGMCIRVGKTEEFIENQQLIDTLVAQNPTMKKHYFASCRNFIRYYKTIGQWEEIIRFYDKSVRTVLQQYAQHENLEIVLNTILVLMEAFLVLKQYKKAQECLAFVDIHTLELQHRLYDFMVLIEIIYYIEQQDWIYLEIYTKKIRKRLKNNKVKKVFLETVIAFSQKLATLGASDQRKLYQQHRENLENIAQQDATIATFAYFFGYDTWLEAKIKGIDWLEFLLANPYKSAEEYF